MFYNLLPDTNKKRYLTGMTALNIPAPERTGGDWHFFESFYGRGKIKPKIFVAGEGEALNTNPILQDFGIHECSNELREMGIDLPHGKKVYAANHYRAILDMLYECVAVFKSYPSYLTVDDWLDNEEEKRPFLNSLLKFKPHLKAREWKMIQDWLSKQA